jgi:type I restriction enzyme S subunit
VSLPPYPKYKGSGLAWMGQVPEHWNVNRLKLIASVQGGIAKGKDTAGQETVRLPYLRVANVQDGYLDLTEIATMEISDNEIGRYLLQTGDVLMNEGGDFDKLGRGYIWRGEIAPCSHQNHVFAVRPYRVSPEWLNAITGSAYAQFYFKTRSKQSTNLASISSTNLMELPVILPPAKDQETILRFLDRETAKIEALIGEQQRLIELLKEKRQAVISHAVTKGLSLVAPMKDSGVEWLGTVPKHWNVSRLGFESWVRARLGWKGLKAEEYVEDGYVLLSTPNIKGAAIDFENVNYINEHRYEESPEIRLCVGDVLLAKDGSTLGTVNLVRCLPRPSTVNSSIAVITPGDRLEGAFLYYLFETSYMENTIQRIKGGMGVPHLFQEDLNKFFIPLPPVSEQQKIAGLLDHETAKFDALVAEAERGIMLLQERRTALISAAVTGKIDQRGLHAREKEAAA